MKGRHAPQARSQPAEPTSWPGSSTRDAIRVISSVARPHICSSGCAHLSLRSASAPGAHSKPRPLESRSVAGEDGFQSAWRGGCLLDAAPGHLGNSERGSQTSALLWSSVYVEDEGE